MIVLQSRSTVPGEGLQPVNLQRALERAGAEAVGWVAAPGGD